MRKAVALIVIVGALWGCAVLNTSYKLGNQAELNRNYDEAIKYYERAALENPKEPAYRLALLRAKSAAGMISLQRARALAADGQREAALEAYKKALAYDPLNRPLKAEIEKFAAPPQAAPARPVEDDLASPIKLSVSDEKVKLKFSDAPLRSIFTALGKHAGVNFIYDEQFRDIPMTIDLTDRTFTQAVSFLCLASKNFSRPVDEKTVVIVPDQPMKRLQYEANAIKTFYLSNINAADIQNSLAQMVRTQYKAPSIIVDKTLNSITIRDTPSGVRLAGKLIRTWDKPKGEVVIDLEIMEISRIKERDIGLDLGEVGDSTLGLRYSGGETYPETGWISLSNLDFTKSGNFQFSLPTSFLKILQSDSDTKMIAQPRLRGVGSEEIKYLVGQKVPVTQATFTPITTGATSTTSFEYKDVGIDLKIKPRIHSEGEVTLEIEIKITSITGKGVSDMPIIGTREVKNTIRLKDGETNLLAGLLRDEERRGLKGIAGLKDIPILGRLFSNTDANIEQTDVIMTITPYIIRSVPITEEDTKPVWIDVEGLSVLGAGRSPDAEEPIEETMEPGEDVEEPEVSSALLLSPSEFEIPRGREFRLSVEMRSQAEIGTLSASFSYDPGLLKLKDVVEGGLARQAGAGGAAPFTKTIDPAGFCTISVSGPAMGKGFRGGGVLAVLVFEAVAAGEADVEISDVSGKGVSGQPLQFDTSPARIVVR